MLAAHATLSSTNENDTFQIQAFFDDAGLNEYCSYTYDFTDFDPATYTKFYIGWYTNVDSNGAGARAKIIDTDGNEQWLLGATIPQFSTTRTVTSGTITDNGFDIDLIRLYADDYPDNVASSTYYVLYDFVLFCQDSFTFPNVTGVSGLEAVSGHVDIPIWGHSEITQYGGPRLVTPTIRGDMEIGGSSWGTPKGQLLFDILHMAHNEPWQWFECDEPNVNFKVTLRRFGPAFHGGADGKPEYVVVLKEYSKRNVSDYSSSERFGTTL